MRVLTGTSGYAYKAWKGSFYPDDLKDDQADIDRWAELITEQSWDEAYCFFKHEDAAAGPRLAKRLAERLG